MHFYDPPQSINKQTLVTQQHLNMFSNTTQYTISASDIAVQ